MEMEFAARSRANLAHIQYAMLQPLNLVNVDLGDAIIESIVPGTSTDRFRRTWRMGQYEVREGVLVGRIGFQTEPTTELWDEGLNDFIEATSPNGTTAPFAIRLADGRVAFQRRGQQIKPKGFVGALQALMNRASPFTRWRVHRETQPLAFSAWVESVAQVTELKLVMRRPNPHYGDNHRVEELIEGTRVQVAELLLKADPDSPEGVDLADEFVREGLEHAERYGSVRAKGELPTGEESSWRDDSLAPPEDVVPADPATGEVGHVHLRGLLEEGPTGGSATLGPPDDEDDEDDENA